MRVMLMLSHMPPQPTERHFVFMDMYRAAEVFLLGERRKVRVVPPPAQGRASDRKRR